MLATAGSRATAPGSSSKSGAHSWRVTSSTFCDSTSAFTVVTHVVSHLWALGLRDGDALSARRTLCSKSHEGDDAGVGHGPFVMGDGRASGQGGAGGGEQCAALDANAGAGDTGGLCETQQVSQSPVHANV